MRTLSDNFSESDIFSELEYRQRGCFSGVRVRATHATIGSRGSRREAACPVGVCCVEHAERSAVEESTNST